MRAGVVVWLAGGLACACWGADPLGELIERALAANKEIQALRQRVGEAEGMLRQAGLRPALSLEASGATGSALGSRGEEEFAAGLAHTIETGGKRTRRVRVAEKQVALARAELSVRARQLAYEITLRFTEAQGEAARLGVLDQIEGLNRKALEVTRIRVQKGDAAPLEENLLAVEVSRARAQARATLGRLEAAQADLRRLAGLPGEANLEAAPLAAGGEKRLDLEALKQAALARRPELIAARLVEEQARAEEDLAEAEGRPNVTLAAQYARRWSRFGDQFGLSAEGRPVPLEDRDDVLTFGISVPLLTRGRNRGNLEAAAARAAAGRLRREHLEASIPLEVEAAFRRLERAGESARALGADAVPLAQANLEVVRQAYAMGQLRLLDVLNEQRKVQELQFALIDARMEAARNLAELERAVGEALR